MTQPLNPAYLRALVERNKAMLATLEYEGMDESVATCKATITAIEALCEQEPVAWRYPWEDDGWYIVDGEEIPNSVVVWQPLYAAPRHASCPGVQHAGCDYLAACGSVCDKCGQVVKPMIAAAPRPAVPQQIAATHETADAFWKSWRENGETHKHGYFESTWLAINAALAAAHRPAEGIEQEPVVPSVIVTGPTACGKSFVMEIIYRALRDAGLHPYSNELAHERRMMDAQPFPKQTAWRLIECNYAAPRPAVPEKIKPTHKAADAFWKYWRENGETHKHGYYESTWGAINAALAAAAPKPEEK